jgi:hypothetical protein
MEQLQVFMTRFHSSLLQHAIVCKNETHCHNINSVVKMRNISSFKMRRMIFLVAVSIQFS